MSHLDSLSLKGVDNFAEAAARKTLENQVSLVTVGD
jgi:hypothetical protein